MTVYTPGLSQYEHLIRELRRGRIPIVCEGDCDGVGAITPSELAERMDRDNPELLGIHEPCGESMKVPEITNDLIIEED